MHRAARPEPLSTWAVVDVVCRIIAKAAALEGAIISLRPVEHRDMWSDALVLDSEEKHEPPSDIDTVVDSRKVLDPKTAD